MTKDREGKGYRSAIALAIHRMIDDAHDAGVIGQATFSFDEVCLESAPDISARYDTDPE